MGKVIREILSNFFLWTTLLGIIIGLCKAQKQSGACNSILRELFFWFTGIAFLYSGAMHLLMPEFTAAQIGWQNSPFQFEVGLANLSISLLGFMAYFNQNRLLHLSAILALAIFSVGAGIGHVHQMISHHNLAPANSGPILYTDLLVPLLMLALWLCLKTSRSRQ